MAPEPSVPVIVLNVQAAADASSPAAAAVPHHGLEMYAHNYKCLEEGRIGFDIVQHCMVMNVWTCKVQGDGTLPNPSRVLTGQDS